MAEILRFSTVTEGPAQDSGREIARTSRRSVLVLLQGTMRVIDDLGQEAELTAPATMQWWPGERVWYGAPGEGALWLFLEGSPRPHPEGFPVPGSRVVVTDEDGAPTWVGTVIFYADTTVEASGTNWVSIEVDGQGVGHYALSRLVEVLEEPH